MAGFASLDQVINSVSVNNKLQKLQINKVLPSTTVANVPHTFWKATGNPAAGSDPVNGMAGAVACTSSTTGAILYTNPTGPATMHILSGVTTSSALGTFILVDRLAHANINNAQATASFSPVLSGTGRLDTGEGAQIIMEVTSALSAASNTRTFTYTNEAGTGSRTTQNIVTVASAVAGRVPYASYIWVPLQSGDKGVRSVESTTLVSGTATGAYNVVLVKPLAYFVVNVTYCVCERDFVVEIPSLPRIKDNSCLMLFFLPNGASTATCLGEVKISEN
jgi:hypothetical protein